MVKIFKLVDGTYVVGKEGEVAIEDAIEVLIQASDRGLTVGMSPFMFPFNQSMTGQFIDLSKVLSSIEADEQMNAQYVQVTTGIVLTNQMPPKGTGLSLVKP